MPLSTSPSQLHFYCEDPFKGFARIEGLVTLDSNGVTFEYAMSESVGTTPKGSVRKFLSFDDISSIELRRQWLSTSRLRFRSKTLKAIESYPTTDPSVFEIEISSQSRPKLTAFHLLLQQAFDEHQKAKGRECVDH
jgi:hypothetical protein